MEERGYLENIGLGRRIILRYIFREWERWARTGLISAQYRDRWLEIVNAAMNLRVS
jgi:hypothetical protein